MANNVEVVLSAQDASTVRAWMNAKNSIAAYEAALAQVDTAQQKNSKSAKEFDKTLAEGKRLTESLATAQEAHNARLERYRELLASGAINQQTFDRAVKTSTGVMNAKAGAIENTAQRMIGMVAGYASLTAAVDLYRKASEEAIKKAEEAADKQDELARRYRVQAGLTQLGGDEAKQSITRIAKETASTTEAAFDAATALTSTGFDAKEASGPALEATLKLIQAQQLKGKNVDAGSLAEAASQYLASQGKAKSGENLMQLAVAVQGMKDTPLKITDLADLAKEGATLKGKIAYEDQLANFAMLRETMGASEAATGMRNVALHLATAGGAKDKTQALKQIGLKPGDVDLVGESFDTALSRIQAGLQKVPESKRAAILKTLVESANIAAFDLLSNNQERVAELRKKGQDAGALEGDFQIGATGRNAAKRRLQAEAEIMDAEAGQGTQVENTRQAYQNVLREKGVGVFSRNLKGMQFNLLTSLGMSPESAVGWTAPTGDAFGGTQDYVRAVRNKVAQANDPEGFLKKELEEMRKATEALRDTAQALQPQQPPTVNVVSPVNPAPVGPVAAAGIGGQP